jgi:hypothetical protein
VPQFDTWSPSLPAFKAFFLPPLIHFVVELGVAHKDNTNRIRIYRFRHVASAHTGRKGAQGPAQHTRLGIPRHEVNTHHPLMQEFSLCGLIA